jgi:hypothetical protein
MNFEKLESTEKNVISIAKSRSFSVLSMMQTATPIIAMPASPRLGGLTAATTGQSSPTLNCFSWRWWVWEFSERISVETEERKFVGVKTANVFRSGEESKVHFHTMVKCVVNGRRRRLGSEQMKKMISGFSFKMGFWLYQPQFSH